jgi:hypothetical protein
MGVNGICSILMGLQSNTWGFGLEPKQSCLSQDCQLLAEDQHPSRSIHHQSKLASWKTTILPILNHLSISIKSNFAPLISV